MTTESPSPRTTGDEAGPDGRPTAAAPAPATNARAEESPERVRRRGSVNGQRRTRKVRRVHRVLRHVEVWSVFKLASVYAVCGYVVGLVSGYLLWQAAERVGTIDGIEGFMVDTGFEDFELLGGTVFRVAAVSGLMLAALAVFLVTLGAVLFNLISDLTGGVRVTVIDEDLIVTPVGPRRPRPARDLLPPADPGGPDPPGPR